MDEQVVSHIRKSLGAFAEDFLAVLNQSPKRAVRVNTLKISVAEAQSLMSLQEPNVYCDEAFLADDTLKGTHPYHHAGLIYFQEPSAMLAIEAARPYLTELFARNDYPLVLDLCAAPGGKSGQAAALLNGRGALISNEIDFRRAKVLSSNLERLGVRNCAVLSDTPERIASCLQGVFDAVIVDAPCSGEGMLRKEPDALKNMNDKTVAACAARQREILISALRCLKEGGILVYSTCTLNETENELSLLPFISSGELKPLECPHLKLVHRSERFFAYRALPQDGAGEGHFVCVLRKTSGGEKKPKLVAYGDRVKNIGELSRLAASLTKEPLYGEPRMRNDGVYLCPLLPPMSGLCVVRLGVQLASPIKNGFIPSHSFVAAMKKDTAQDPLNFRLGIDAERQAVERYLMGDTVSSAPEIRGFKAVAVDSFPLGLVKASGGEAKNHYPKGLRNLART